MTIHEETLHLLKNRCINLTFAEISENTGIKVSWLRAFSQEKMQDPGVNKVELLNKYLLNKKGL